VKLSRAQRAKLLNGDYRPLVLEARPDFTSGSSFVFVWSHAKRHADKETGQVFEAPAEPLAWIKATRIVRQTKHWVVHFDVFDNRHASLMLARGSGYTTDPRIAIDRSEAVLDEADVRRLATDAKAQRAAQLARSEDARRAQERSIRSRLRETLRTLSPTGRAALLAEVERVIAAANHSEDEPRDTFTEAC
jgi:hypothetical protein